MPSKSAEMLMSTKPYEFDGERIPLIDSREIAKRFAQQVAQKREALVTQAYLMRHNIAITEVWMPISSPLCGLQLKWVFFPYNITPSLPAPLPGAYWTIYDTSKDVPNFPRSTIQ